MCGGDPPVACSFYRGQEVLERIIAERPEVFFLAMVKLAQGVELAFGYMAVFYEEPPARKSSSDWRRFDDRPRGTFWSA